MTGKRRRVTLIQDYLRGGGTEKHTVLLANHLFAEGHEVSVITFRPGGVWRSELNIPRVNQKVLQPWDLKLNFFAPGLLQALRVEQPDTVILMGRMANNQGAKIKQAFPVARLIGTMRSGNQLPAANLRTFAVADAIWVNSNWAKEQLRSAQVEADKISVFHNPMTRDWDYAEREQARAEMRRAMQVEEDVCVNVCVLGFRPNKGQIDLIHAFAQLASAPRGQLWLVGEGPERAACESAVHRLGLEAQVRFCGFVADPFAHFAAADMAVTMSQMESQPNALIEAQWMGLPVVAYDTGGSSECLTLGETGWSVAPGATDLFLEKWSALLQNENGLRTNMGASARKMALQRFDRIENLKAYESFL